MRSKRLFGLLFFILYVCRCWATFFPFQKDAVSFVQPFFCFASRRLCNPENAAGKWTFFIMFLRLWPLVICVLTSFHLCQPFFCSKCSFTHLWAPWFGASQSSVPILNRNSWKAEPVCLPSHPYWIPNQPDPSPWGQRPGWREQEITDICFTDP